MLATSSARGNVIVEPCYYLIALRTKLFYLTHNSTSFVERACLTYLLVRLSSRTRIPVQSPNTPRLMHPTEQNSRILVEGQPRYIKRTGILAFLTTQL